MYHRNKVHTDEFWKYELAKHRRTVLDSKTNEDMWKKQLGKHADEVVPVPSGGLTAINDHHVLHQRSNEEIHKQSPDRWLEQIKLSTANDPNQNNQVSTEMKLLALQSLQSSLQNSLQMMNMKKPSPKSSSASEAGLISRPQTPPSCSPPTAPTPNTVVNVPPPPPSHGGYLNRLNLLAHLSAQRKAETEGFEVERPRKVSECSAASSPASYLPDVKEECPTKRTQMWLAQLGRYRQKSFQDEIDRNHEELWEEQIAKVKHNPVRSPIEPIEIILEDNEEAAAAKAAAAAAAAAATAVNAAEEVRGGLKPKAEVPIVAAVVPKPTALTTPRIIPLMSALECYPPPRRPSSPPKQQMLAAASAEPLLRRPPTPVSPIPNVISIKTSAISRVENQPRTFSLNLEINNNNEEHQPPPPRRHIPVPVIPTSREAPPPVKRRLLEIPEDDLAPHPIVGAPVNLTDHEEISNNNNPTKQGAVGAAPTPEDSSVLKSLLMDRLPRKRPLSPVPEVKRPSISGGESDILRKRLLGLKAEPEAASVAPASLVKPRFQPPSATITSEQLQEHRHHQAQLQPPNGQSNHPVDLRNKEEAAPLHHAVHPILSVAEMQQQPQLLAASGNKNQLPAAAAQQPPKSYTQTSVLKHLLYRYTASGQEEEHGDH